MVKIGWLYSVSTTDGAPAMLGRKSGFQSYVKAVPPEIIFTHCFIHRFALCAKVLPPELLSCLQQIVKIVNFVKTSALNTRLFAKLCAELGSDHTCLLCCLLIQRCDGCLVEI